MSRLGRTRAAVAAVVLAAACERSGRAVEVGRECPSAAGSGRSVTLSVLLLGGGPSSGTGTWLHVWRPDQLAKDGPADMESSRQRVRLTSAQTVKGPPAAREEPVVLFGRAADEAVAELERGSSVVIVRPASGVARAVASVGTGGDVAFLGECAHRALTVPYERFVARRHAGGDTRSPAVLLFALATDSSLADELRASEAG